MLDFEQTAHVSGSRANSFDSLTCIRETKSSHRKIITPSVALALSAAIAINIACISRPRTTQPTTKPLVASSENTHRINLNTASADELEALPGIGKGLAQRIVLFRNEHGPFRRTEHLMMVQGISEEKFLAIRDRITV